MPSARLSKALREELLGKLREGHDLESAAAALGITEKQIQAVRDKLGTEIATARRTGTAKLRALILERALSDDNVGVLLKIWETREREAEADPQPITLIKHIIIEPVCPHCGKRPVVRDGEGKVRQFHPRGNGNGSKRIPD